MVQHLQKVGAAAGTDTFVWSKKVEKELGEGKKIKEISIFTDRHRQAERIVGCAHFQISSALMNVFDTPCMMICGMHHADLVVLVA